MKARVKATGEIVEVRYSHHSIDCPSLHYYKSQDGSTYKEESLDFGDIFDYWTRLEHQYVGMAMQGLMSYVEQITPKKGRSFCDEIVDISFTVAHALVEKYKRRKSNGNVDSKR